MCRPKTQIGKKEVKWVILEETIVRWLSSQGCWILMLGASWGLFLGRLLEDRWWEWTINRGSVDPTTNSKRLVFDKEWDDRSPVLFCRIALQLEEIPSRCFGDIVFTKMECHLARVTSDHQSYNRVAVAHLVIQWFKGRLFESRFCLSTSRSVLRQDSES